MGRLYAKNPKKDLEARLSMTQQLFFNWIVLGMILKVLHAIGIF